MTVLYLRKKSKGGCREIIIESKFGEIKEYQVKLSTILVEKLR
jgi:hypothetical protein